MKHLSSLFSGLHESQRRLTRVELLLAVALFVVGAGLRCAYPSRMAIEHFDEGVYASNYWFGPTDDFRYPDQHLYAPPLLPTLIEWIFTLCGPSNLGAMVPSLVAGCLTVPLVWWVGRSWFGPAAGIASAALCAFNDAHIAFSRTALTDVLLCFWLLLAVHCMWLALTTRRVWPTFAAGLFTGLAWWTKYTGWLPLAIGGSAIVPWVLLRRYLPKIDGASHSETDESGISNLKSQISNLKSEVEQSRLARLIRSLLRWSVIATIAFAVWSPWLWSLQSKGGYGAVAANHRGYVVGWSGWIDSFDTQMARNLGQLEGTCSHHSIVIALLLAAVWMHQATGRFTWNMLMGHPATYVVVGVVFLLTPGFEPGLLTALLAALGLVANLISGTAIEDSTVRNRVSLAAWLLAAWLVGLSLTIPLYRPYPRLVLPWLMASWLGCGLGITFLVSQLVSASRAADSNLTRFLDRVLLLRQSGAAPRGVMLFGAIAACVLVIYHVETQFIRQGVPGWDDRTSIASLGPKYRDACREQAQQAGADPDHFVIYMFGEPALFFQLRLASVELVQPVASFNLPGMAASAHRLPTFVVLGSHARQSKTVLLEYETAQDGLQLLLESPLDLSRLVDLDHRSKNDPLNQSHVFELDRVR